MATSARPQSDTVERQKDIGAIVGGAGRLHLAAATEHPSDADGAQGNRECVVAAEEFGSQIDRARALKNALAKVDFSQIGNVVVERQLRICAAVGVVKKKRRNAAAGDFSKVLGGGDDHGGVV